MSKAPPIGIEPEWIWRIKRRVHLRQAVERYMQDGTTWIIGDWLDEIERHELWLREYHLPGKNLAKIRELSNHETLELWLRLRELGFEVLE